MSDQQIEHTWETKKDMIDMCPELLAAYLSLKSNNTIVNKTEKHFKNGQSPLKISEETVYKRKNADPCDDNESERSSLSQAVYLNVDLFHVEKSTDESPNDQESIQTVQIETIADKDVDVTSDQSTLKISEETVSKRKNTDPCEQVVYLNVDLFHVDKTTDESPNDQESIQTVQIETKDVDVTSDQSTLKISEETVSKRKNRDPCDEISNPKKKINVDETTDESPNDQESIQTPQIETILEHALINGKMKYKIKYESESESGNGGWEFAETLMKECPELLKYYNEVNKVSEAIDSLLPNVANASMPL
jgi:hypothetical protein